MLTSDHSGTEAPLLKATVDGCVDYKGLAVYRASCGGWRSAYCIIGVEMAERFAFYGICSNLITYLTGPLGQSTATAAENINVWSGTSSLTALLGAFVADSFLGRYRTIVAASVIYVLGLSLLTLSALLPSASDDDSQSGANSGYEFQVVLFFFSLYLVAVGQGGHKPCVQAFGADQFDGQDTEERKLKSSFFNWWYFGVCSATIFAYAIVIYIQDNLNWALGFGVPCISMAIALFVFLLGTKTYRYCIKREENSPFVRIGLVFVAALKNWRIKPSAIALQEEACGTLTHENYDQFKNSLRFLNKALLAPDVSNDCGKVCSISEVNEAKAFLRLVPIWATCLIYAIVLTEPSTLFTKQGVTMDRSITKGFEVSAASLQALVSLATVLTIPIYDRVFVPIARDFTGKPAGITMLQRIGAGMILSVITMVIAALVEMRRLKTAQEYGLVDEPNATIPMSVWWLIPQYAVFGVSETFTMVGLQEFFYDQVPIELRSVGLSLYLSIFGVGSFLSSFFISCIDKATSGDGNDSWFANNLNKGHLDYYYWLVAVLSAIGLVAYLYFAKSYIYVRGSMV